MEWLVQPLINMVLTCVLLVVGYFVARKTVYSAIDSFGDQMAEMLEGIFNPTVKKAYGIIGSQGGKSKAVKELKGRFIKGFIDKNYGLVKMAAEQILGIDVDGLLEQYEPDTIMQAVSELRGLMGEKAGQPLSLGNILGNNGSRRGEVPSM